MKTKLFRDDRKHGSMDSEFFYGRNHYRRKGARVVVFLGVACWLTGSVPALAAPAGEEEAKTDKKVKILRGTDGQRDAAPEIPVPRNSSGGHPFDQYPANRFHHSFDFTARMQTRLIFLGHDGLRDRTDDQDRLLRRVATNSSDGLTQFSLRRLRLGIEGEIGRSWKYELDLKLENLINPLELEEETVLVQEGGELKARRIPVVDEVEGSILDAYIEYELADFFQVQTGATDTPFSRESMTPSYRLLSLERATVTNRLANRRDLGVQFKGDLWAKKFQYGAGMYNGKGSLAEGDNGPNQFNESRDSVNPLYSVRLVYNPLGEYKDGVSLFWEDLLVSVGSGFQYQKKRFAHLDPYKAEMENYWAATTDIGFQYWRFHLEGAWAISGAKYAAPRYYQRVSGGTGREDSAGYSGFYGQLAYFILPARLQNWIKFEEFQNNAFLRDAPLEKAAEATTLLYQKDAAGKIADGRFQNLSRTRYLSFGVTLFLIPAHHMKLQWAYVMGLNKAADLAGNEYTGAGLADDWTALQLQMQF